jgi:hypothetical protein
LSLEVHPGTPAALSAAMRECARVRYC